MDIKQIYPSHLFEDDIEIARVIYKSLLKTNFPRLPNGITNVRTTHKYIHYLAERLLMFGYSCYKPSPGINSMYTVIHCGLDLLLCWVYENFELQPYSKPIKRCLYTLIELALKQWLQELTNRGFSVTRLMHWFISISQTCWTPSPRSNICLQRTNGLTLIPLCDEHYQKFCLHKLELSVYLSDNVNNIVCSYIYFWSRIV